MIFFIIPVLQFNTQFFSNNLIQHLIFFHDQGISTPLFTENLIRTSSQYNFYKTLQISLGIIRSKQSTSPLISHNETETGEHSLLYTAPILLESGDYCIKAVYINENGISSPVVTKNYHIEIEELSAPEVTAVSGDYEFPINIEVTDGYDVYYTTDGSDPTQNSTVYNGPIPMPLGKSVFRFIRIAEGRKSELVEKSYNLVMNTEFMPEDAVTKVVNYAIESGKITEASGSFDESGAAYLYQYQYVTNINKIDDFYVVAEIYRGEDGTVTKTGNLFAVNAYTRELYKLQTDESGRHYTLGDRLDI